MLTDDDMRALRTAADMQGLSAEFAELERCALSAPAAPEPVARYPHPDEDDAVTLWAEIHRLRAAVQGPDGYATWQEAATAERLRRIRAERALAATPAAPSVPEGWAVRDRSDLEPGAIDLTSPGGERVNLLPCHRDAHSRTLYALASALLAAAPQPGAHGADGRPNEPACRRKVRVDPPVMQRLVAHNKR
jgi:hypothetical protein